MPGEYQSIEAEERDGVLILTIAEKELNSWQVAEQVRKDLVEAYSVAASDKVVVDLSRITYMASVGYGPFLSLKRRVGETGGQLILANMSDFVQSIFKATHLLISPKSKSSVFHSAEGVDQAIADLKAGEASN